MKKQLLIVVLIILLTLVASCNPNSEFDNEEGDSNTAKSSFVISFRYRNVNRESPQVQLVNVETSPEISFTNHSVIKDSEGVQITFENLSINNENTSFTIESKDDISCQVFNGTKWITDTEFLATFKAQSKIAVVLVLDKSQSISPENFIKIKTYAKDFINIIYTANNDAEIGLVSFSSNNLIHFVEVHPKSKTYGSSYRPDTHHTILIRHIDEMTQGKYTALFDAINKAHSLINFDNYEGCAIVSFTDGWDNDSTIQQSDLITKLKSSDKLKSFTIGFGDVKDSELQALAVNGQYKRVNSIKDLETVFKTFSKTVSSFHNVTLRRSSGVVKDWVNMRLSFYAK